MRHLIVDKDAEIFFFFRVNVDSIWLSKAVKMRREYQLGKCTRLLRHTGDSSPNVSSELESLGSAITTFHERAAGDVLNLPEIE
ncbi:hypothetical protein NECAME_02376 [Necator americanus]|uniref:Uncharacterized protein n=1 Tax=Necator americanus TaxID=51031 RepID=W2TFK4_NECAM|nr:hypothetical protein NECAME_02376 [Necator americanus]ETN80628.1 hypothetical protein NECAME_02376 [Necator americanus]